MRSKMGSDGAGGKAWGEWGKEESTPGRMKRSQEGKTREVPVPLLLQ